MHMLYSLKIAVRGLVGSFFYTLLAASVELLCLSQTTLKVCCLVRNAIAGRCSVRWRVGVEIWNLPQIVRGRSRTHLKRLSSSGMQAEDLSGLNCKVYFKGCHGMSSSASLTTFSLVL